MGRIKIIKARRGHIPQVVELWKDFMDFHAALNPFYTRTDKAYVGYEKRLLKTLGSRTKQIFVAVDNKKVIGFTFAEVYKHSPLLVLKTYGYISDHYVDPGYRRRGIGEALFKSVIDWLRDRDITQMELGIAAENTAAISFWRKMGFKERVLRMHLEL